MPEILGLSGPIGRTADVDLYKFVRDVQQNELFNSITEELVQAVYKGKNACLFIYGWVNIFDGSAAEKIKERKKKWEKNVNFLLPLLSYYPPSRRLLNKLSVGPIMFWELS